MHKAALERHCDVIQLLHQLGANVNAANNDDCTPVYAAAKQGHCDVIRLLRELGANVNTASKDGGCSSL